MPCLHFWMLLDCSNIGPHITHMTWHISNVYAGQWCCYLLYAYAPVSSLYLYLCIKYIIIAGSMPSGITA